MGPSSYSFLIQGSVTPHTQKLCKDIKAFLPEVEVVFSTCDSTVPEDLGADVIVQSEDPGDFFYVNANRLITNTREGLKRCSNEMVVKLRSDSILLDDRCIHLFDTYKNIPRADKHKFFENRIIAFNFFTLKSKFGILLSISDFTFIGLKKDLLKYWDIDIVNKERYDFLLHTFSDTHVRQKILCSEQFVLFSSLHKHGYKECPTKDTDDFIANNFIIQDEEALGIRVPKHKITYDQYKLDGKLITNEETNQYLSKFYDFNTYGLSGCDKQLINGNFVKTYPARCSRLPEQLHKQNTFKKCHPANFDTPNILEHTDLSITMEYIDGISMISYITVATKEDLEYLTKCLEKLFTFNLEQCTIRTIPKDIFLEKLCALKPSLGFLGESFTSIVEEEINLLLRDEVTLPEGLCHGDLTLSNILVKDKTFFLIDFLAPFVSSPIQDFVKLRQDTRYFWSLHRDSRENTSIKEKLLQVDNFLITLENDLGLKHYKLFQIFNLLRILPYAKEEETKQFVAKSLVDLLGRT
jgi:hypothetical protein